MVPGLIGGDNLLISFVGTGRVMVRRRRGCRRRGLIPVLRFKRPIKVVIRPNRLRRGGRGRWRRFTVRGLIFLAPRCRRQQVPFIHPVGGDLWRGKSGSLWCRRPSIRFRRQLQLPRYLFIGPDSVRRRGPVFQLLFLAPR